MPESTRVLVRRIFSSKRALTQGHFKRFVLYATVLVAPLHVYRRTLGPLNVSFFRVFLAGLAVVVLIGVFRRPRALLPAASRLKWSLLGTLAFLALGVLERARSATGLGTTVLGQQVVFFASVVIVAAAVILLNVAWTTLRRVFLASAILPYLLAIEQWAKGTSSQSLPFQSLISGHGGLDLLRSGGYSATGIRPAATFSDPNFLGVFCAVTFMLADQHRAETKGLERLVAVAFQAGSIVVLVLCGSRTGLVAVAAYVAVKLLQIAGRGRNHPRLTVALAVGGLALLASLAFVTLAGRGNSSLSSERHVEMDLTGLGVGLAHPSLGIGLANLGPLLAEPPDRSSANALPLTLLAEEGAIGLILCGVALGAPILKSVRIDPFAREAGMAVSLAVALWFYDFVFVIDVAALWWALLMVRGATERPDDAVRDGLPVLAGGREPHVYGGVAPL